MRSLPESMTRDAHPLVFRQVGTPAYQEAADDAFEQARLRGYATGHAAGVRAAAIEAEVAAERVAADQDAVRAAFTKQAGTAIMALTEATARADEVEADKGLTDRTELVRLAVELAETILGAELAQEDRSAQSVIGRLLDTPDARSAHQVRVNERDLAVLEREGLLPDGPEFVADESLAPGDAVVELVDGRLDMRIRAALDRARQLTSPIQGADSPV